MSKTDEERDSAILDESIRLLRQTNEYRLLLEKLKPLVQPILSSSDKSKELRDFLRESSNRFKKSRERMRLLKKDSKAEYESQLDTLRKAFLYLVLFETTATNILNLIVMLLVLNGHDFFVQYPRKYAKAFDDLDDANMAEKLDFLDFHGFSILRKHVNRKLRNKIAHMDFDIEGKGMIHVGKQKYNLQDEIVKLEAILLVTGIALGSSGLAGLLTENT